MSDEVILPPRGYCIGVFGHGQGDGLIGPFATEDEAREALANAVICAVGGPSGWHLPASNPPQEHPKCANCGVPLGEAACVTDIAPGMFCSDRCRRVAEIDEVLKARGI